MWGLDLGCRVQGLGFVVGGKRATGVKLKFSFKV